MRATDIIAKKRDGARLTDEEIRWFVLQYTTGEIPDYQAAAWLMAVFNQGMSREEITSLTLAMAASGDQLDLSDIIDFVVDKHSSGGVGDKTSLVVLPIVAACGVPVAKMSGRGLGHTGGTIDKMESIRGFRTELTRDEFKRLAREHGLVLSSQSANLAPADKAFYSLRDVTATVNSIPLIASSIMSKKLAAGADAIVLDVKVGKGAFMPQLLQAQELARTMVNIGVDAGRKMVAVISDMNQPLGNAAGHALEIREVIDTLHYAGPQDFQQHSLIIASYMLQLAGKGELNDCRAIAELALIDGSAWRKFYEMVEAQGGDVSQIENPDLLPTASIIEDVISARTGYIADVDALAVGYAVLDLGGGRLVKEDPVDHAVGVVTHVKVGDYVKTGDKLFTFHANDADRLRQARTNLLEAVQFSDKPVSRPPLIYDVYEG